MNNQDEVKKIYFKDIGGLVLEPISFYIKVFDLDFYMGMHNHGYFEFMYAARGNFNIEILKDPDNAAITQPEKAEKSEITSLTIHQGEFIFIDAYLFHRLKIPEKDVMIYNIELEPKQPKDYNPFNVNSIIPIYYGSLIEGTSLKNIARSPAKYSILTDNSKVSLAFHNLIASLLKRSDCIEDACTVQCHLLLFFNEIAKSATAVKQGAVSFLKKAFVYLKNNLNKKITLAQIAEAAGLSKEYLATQFKKMTGKTVFETLTSMRISKSLQLLRESNFPVSEIAKQVGFSSYGQMLYEFRKTTGITPTECRQSFLNDEIDHTSKLYKSVAVRIDEEDFMLDDDAFYHSFFKKNIESKTQKILKDK